MSSASMTAAYVPRWLGSTSRSLPSPAAVRAPSSNGGVAWVASPYCSREERMPDPSDVERSLDEAIDHLRAVSGPIHLKQAGARVLVLAASRNIPAPVLEVVREVPWG